MMKTAPDVGASILRGQQTINTAKEFLPKGDGQTAAWAQDFDKLLPASIFSLGARTDATGSYAVAQGMVKARYADLSAQLGDNSGTFKKERLEQAVNDVTGGTVDSSTAAAMTWTPSAAATDIAGNATRKLKHTSGDVKMAGP